MTADPPRQALLERQAEILAHLQSDRAAKMAAIPGSTMLWLALAPSWTAELATRAGLPAEGESALAALERIAELGLCRRGDAGPRLKSGKRATGPTFWMDNAEREEQLSRIARTDEGRRIGGAVTDELPQIAAAVLGAQQRGIALPSQVERWAQLAQHAKAPIALAEALVKHVEQHLKDGTPSEATRWVEAARILEIALGQGFTPAVERAARRIELHHRRLDDERKLKPFLERERLDRAFHDLMVGPDKYWALHFVGSGGVGKTMLVRHITAHLAAAEPSNAICAQVDFDYLSPDFPTRSPGLLLTAFAEELRLQDEAGAAGPAFDVLQQQTEDLHRRRGATLLRSSAAQPLDERELDNLAGRFADGVKQLGRRVVLLLDTCEELAKVQPDATVPENVKTTFDTLSRLPGLLGDRIRVVFCGRRPLASSGAGWSFPDSPQPERPYLRLHEVVGFTDAEANRYLDEKRPVPDHLRHAVIARCTTNVEATRFVPKPHPEATFTPPGGESRINPFELALYAELAAAGEGVTADAIKDRKIDPYVEFRIARRIGGHLTELVIAAALAGRFDRDLISAASVKEPAAFDAAFEELVDQRWVSRQGFRFFEVDAGLRPRLERYYRRHEGFAGVRRRLVDHLETRTRTGSREALDRSFYDTLLRLLHAEPERATHWWRDIEERFVRENTFHWAFEICSELVAERPHAVAGDEVAADAHPLRPAILATYASACLHHRPGADRTLLWEEAERLLGRDGDPELRIRVIAGQVAAAADTDDPVANFHTYEQLKFIDSHWTVLRDAGAETVAAVAAAVEACVERGERSSSGVPITHHRAVARSAGELVELVGDMRLPPELPVFARSLAGRAALLLAAGLAEQGEPDAAVRAHGIDALQEALHRARTVTPSGRLWLDWRAPRDLEARLGLEVARCGLPPGEALAALGSPPAAESSDGRYLAAAIVSLRAALQPPGRGDLSILDDTHSWDEPECNAHAAFDPPQVVQAREQAARGAIGPAVERLRRARGAAERANATSAARAADREILRIARRMRLGDEPAALPTLRTGIELEPGWV